MLLSNKSFNEIVQFYQLEDAINYYKLYNNSKYLNSYHGWNHVKNVLCSLQAYLSRKYDHHELSSMEVIRSLFIALIFHDFNYQRCDAAGTNYDIENIEFALTGFFDFARLKNINFSDASFIEELIRSTEYPRKKNSNISMFLQDLINDVDHSMPMFVNYPALAFNLLVSEFKCRSLTECLLVGDGYLHNLKFEIMFFQTKWKELKNKIIEEAFNEIKTFSNRSFDLIKQYEELEVI